MCQKMAQYFYMPITPSIINRFSKFFHWWNQHEICSNNNTPTTPHRCRYTTVWNVRHRTLAGDDNGMINVDWAWHVTFIQTELKSCRLCCSRGSFIDGLSVLTIHDNSGALGGANCRSVWLIALLVSGVISLSASSSSKAEKLNIWCENCEILQLLWKITEAKNMLFCFKFLKMCCYRYRLVFNCCFEDINISLGNVATHLRCGGIFSNSVTANFLLFPTV